MRPIRRRLLGDPGVEAERSVAGRFIRNFDADEIVAFARRAKRGAAGEVTRHRWNAAYRR